MATACSPTKRLTEGEYLLQRNVLETNDIDLHSEGLREIIRPQPNRKILPFMRFHLHMYNLASHKRQQLSREKKDVRIAKKNERRAKKDKKLKGPGRTKWEYFKEVVGEPPVLLDTALVQSSSSQLSTYLTKHGFFINEVSDSIVIDRKRKMANVFYTLTWKEPYVLDTMLKSIEDPRIAEQLTREYESEHLTYGERFDVDNLSDERESITKFLRNRGYYLFTKDYIEFEVDSTLGGRKVSVNLILRAPSDVPADSLGVKYHPVFVIGDIYFNYELSSRLGVSGDTVVTEEYKFIDPEIYPLKTKVLIQNTFLNPDMLYKHERVERTYRRLSSLPALNHVAIRFEPREELLDVFVSMTPARRQSFSVEGQGINSAGFLGLEGDLVYRHRNIFRGAEVLELRFQGGVQSQALITDNTAEDFEQSDNVTFNTIEFGPSISLRFPKFLLPIKMERFAKSANPTSVVTASFSYQNRPDYERQMTGFSFGLEWEESIRKSHQLNLMELSIILIDKSQEFQDQLDELNDSFLSDSYENHFISATTYQFTYNGRKEPSSKNTFYFRGNAEVGGNLLRTAYRLTGQEKDSLGSYEIFGIRFANYFKAFTDSRFYRRFDDKRTIVGRFALGVGVPYGNLDVLPFSKSFFGGGANGLRAWRARTIGPGSFSELVVTYDKIGDVSLEANVEYRFNLTNYFDGAFFIDAGNIWLLNENELRPGGEFRVNRFVSEISVGAGVGFRFDFNFFILRFDLGGQIKDPSLKSGERWLFQPKTLYNESVEIYNSDLAPDERPVDLYRFRLNLNLGIGYPF